MWCVRSICYSLILPVDRTRACFKVYLRCSNPKDPLASGDCAGFLVSISAGELFDGLEATNILAIMFMELYSDDYRTCRKLFDKKDWKGPQNRKVWSLGGCSAPGFGLSATEESEHSLGKSRLVTFLRP